MTATCGELICHRAAISPFERIGIDGVAGDARAFFEMKRAGADHRRLP